MARFALAALALVPLACADASEAAHFELREDDEPASFVLVIPFGERFRDPPPDEPAPAVVEAPEEQEDEAVAPTPWPEHPGKPEIIVGPLRRAVALERDDSEDSAACPFEVKTRGFPAVTLDGRTMVVVSRGVWSAADSDFEQLVVRWHDVDRDAIIETAPVFDGGEANRLDTEEEEARPGHCRRLWKKARLAAETINAELDAQSWRTLTDVGIHARHDDGAWAVEALEDTLALPARARPVELLHVADHVAVRIRGVQVLHRADVDWLGIESWPCRLMPVVRAAIGDAETGTLAVFLDHQTGGCLCYDELEMHTLRLPDAIFAEAAARQRPFAVPDEVVDATQ